MAGLGGNHWEVTENMKTERARRQFKRSGSAFQLQPWLLCDHGESRLLRAPASPSPQWGGNYSPTPRGLPPQYILSQNKNGWTEVHFHSKGISY